MLLVALAGLMAMHGLSDHGVGGPAAMSSMSQDAGSTRVAMGLGAAPAMAAVAGPGIVDTVHPGHFGDAEHAAASAADATSVARSDPGAGGRHGDHGGDDGMLAGMCLAVMAAVLVFSVAAWRTRVRSRLRDFLLQLNRARLSTLRARSWGPAPPDLRLLSIQRC